MDKPSNRSQRPFSGGHSRLTAGARPGVDGDLAAERALAVRLLLATPLLDASRHPDEFRLVARNRGALAEWFENACGWQLAVDVMGGFARLAKHSSTPDPTRPAHRPRGGSFPSTAAATSCSASCAPSCRAMR